MTSDEQTLGQPLTLECRIEAAKGINHTADIIWTTGNTEVRRVENLPGSVISDYTDMFIIPVLKKSDNSTDYRCEVIINTSPLITADELITLIVTRKLLKSFILTR